MNWDLLEDADGAPLPDVVQQAHRAQLADAWDDGYTSGHSRAMRRMSDEPGVEPGVNPYRVGGPHIVPGRPR